MITFCSYRISLWEIGRWPQIILVAALSDDHDLNVFKKLLSLPPMWRKLGYFLPFVILVWPTSPPSAYSGTMMIGRKLDNGEKESFHSLRTVCFSCCEKGKEVMLKIITWTTKFSCKAFHQSERWLRKVSCWNTKFLCLLFFNELRVSSLQFKRFLQTSLRCSFLGIRNDKGLFSFTKCIALEYKLKLSNFVRKLLHEFVYTFYSDCFRPKAATIDIISDICCWLNYKLLKLNLTYWIPLHWIGAIKREGNNTVGKFRLHGFKISIVVLYAFLTFHTSPPNRMRLSGSISVGLVH